VPLLGRAVVDLTRAACPDRDRELRPLMRELAAGAAATRLHPGAREVMHLITSMQSDRIYPGYR
jgi:hypothetical protein